MDTLDDELDFKAIHIKLSTKREVINILYKHNLIHRDVTSRAINSQMELRYPVTLTSKSIERIQCQGMLEIMQAASKPRKRKRARKILEKSDDYVRIDLGMSTSPDASKSSPGKKKKRKNPPTDSPLTKKKQKSKHAHSPSRYCSFKASIGEASIAPTLSKVMKKICLQDREKKIKCDEARPACNQCKWELRICQYQYPSICKRSKIAYFNCRQRKRECSEIKPFRTHCLKVDDDCGYPDKYE
ncbi:hypothetical protein CC78DRAFT_574154 [Lojkania enalia]|uniref:Zn(2)-C6 fungal-type domain-containing protein n=1 Tax=Lojkania enalia TaxID=147567 RepID=A0A9P4TR63_9PLEO|nr:hypothetical protein CC78DRAFT_574154 [Didymosphaeria enalia]